MNIWYDMNNVGCRDPVAAKRVPLEHINKDSAEPAIKFLGIYLDPHLTFNFHINKFATKLASTMHFLKKAKHLLTPKAKLTVYYSLFHSHLQYGILAWCGASQSVLTRLETKQKNAVRLIANLGYNAHTGPTFKRLKILPLSSMIAYAKAIFFYKFTNNLLPSSFSGQWLTGLQKFPNLHLMNSPL